MKRVLLGFLIIITFAFDLGARERKRISIVDPETRRQVPVAGDEIVVKFKPDVQEEAIVELNRKIGARIRKKIGKRNVYCIEIPPSMTILEAIEEYKKDPRVVYAEPSYIRSAHSLPDDYYPAIQWGLEKIKAAQAWSKETGSSDIVIAILDTGVDYNHEDLKDNMWQDSGGYYGRDFVDEDNDPIDEGSESHGTRCAGICSAVTNNGKGIAGVSWNSRIMAVRVLDGDGYGSDPDIAQGIDYAVENGAKILNMSFGGPTSSYVLKEAVNDAYVKGCLLVAASGNDNRSSVDYPARYDSVIAVGATNKYDERCSPSDWGDGLGSNYGAGIEVMAPGRDISSTVSGNFYGQADGTSMSAPFVSGLAALIWAHNPGISNVDVRNVIKSCCDDIGPEGWDIYTGYGRINAEEALATFLSDEVVYNAINYPNPFRPLVVPETTISFTTKESIAERNIYIYNLAGELIHTAPQTEILLEGIDPQNRHVYKYRWDGRNDSGKKVSSGVYIYVIDADGHKKRGKLAVIK